jgi:hypothetical protein
VTLASLPPVHGFVGGQLVDVDHRLPVLCVGAVAVQRGAAVDAARVGVVLMKVVQPAIVFGKKRNLPRVAQVGQDLGLQAGKARVAVQAGAGGGVLGGHPV